MAASIPNPIPTKLLPTRNLMVSCSLLNRNTVFGDVSSLNVKSRKLIKYSSVSRRSAWNSSNYLIRSVLELDGVSSSVRFDSQQKDYQPKVANLKDILSERGACGVGFIANLRNEASHNVVEDALTALGCMEHRGGCGADNTSGDGSGVMTSIPWELFDKWAQEQGIGSLDKKRTGVGMVFLPKDETQMNDAKKGESSTVRIPHLYS